MSFFHQVIGDKKAIAIIGLSKNAGKTTVLNAIIQDYWEEPMAITSIGRDGEERDTVYKCQKPKIYMPKGTLIATGKELYLHHCDCSMKTQQTLPIHTPFGRIILGEAMSDGYVDLAGPSYGEQLEELIKVFRKHRDGLVLIDGAFQRKVFSATSSIEGIVVVVGASGGRDMREVVEQCQFLYETLSLEPLPLELKERACKTIECHLESTVIGRERHFIDSLKKNLGKDLGHSTKEVILDLKGPVTSALAKEILKGSLPVGYKYHIIIEDGTKLLVHREDYRKLQERGFTFWVRRQLTPLCVAYNPYSIEGYAFNDERFFLSLRKVLVNIPLINVVTNRYYLPK